MKRLKKLFSYLIALTMVFSIATLAGVNVYADGQTPSYELKINGTVAGHKYAVYKVFGGDLKVDSSTKTLSNIVWGDGVDGAGLLTALKKDNSFKKDDKDKNVFADASTAADVAKVLSDQKYADNSKEAKAFAQDVGQHLVAVTKTVDSTTTSTIITLDHPGYYFVKNNDDVSGHDAATRFIVQVVGPAEVTVKSSVPTVTKKVDDINDSTGTEEKLKDSADYDIGDDVPYTITGTLPSTYEDYSSYNYVFTDTMSKGLTYTENSFKVTLYQNDTDSTGTDVTNWFTETINNPTPDDGDKYSGGKKITWSCDDLKKKDTDNKVSKDAKFVVTYKAKLNENANIGSAGNPNKVDLIYSNNPNNGGKGKTGKTPEDTNIVFTYAANFNKVDGSQKPLPNAKFTLYKFTKTKIDESDKSDTYNNVVGYWHSLGEKEAEKVVDKDQNTKYTANYKGLDDGVYKLSETHTPDGYNTMSDKIFTLTATHNDGDQPSFGTLTVNGLTTTINDATTINDGTINTNIVNNKGSILPSTGGMGTTLLYAAGGILVACAVAYVVLNKKHAK